MRVVAQIVFGVLLVISMGCTAEQEPGICGEDATALFERRIAPILVEDRPKTCNQCHLAGVDLSVFVRDTPCQTMACLIQLDLVDLDAPDESLVLSWIGRATPDSALITEDVIATEHEAFREWIVHTAECGGLEACGEVDCGPAEPNNDCEVRRTREDPDYSMDPLDCSPIAREEAFLNQVYAWRGRCFPCHFINSPYDVEGAPKWIDGGDTCGHSSLASMQNLFELDVLDFETPEMSRFLLKPLAENQGGIMHGGHDKFVDTDDPAYRAFRAWIEYEADCRR